MRPTAIITLALLFISTCVLKSQFLRYGDTTILNAQLNNWTPDSAKQFKPPPIYKYWWIEIEDCAKLFGDFDRISWYQVKEYKDSTTNDYRFWCPGVAYCSGWWVNHHVYIAWARMYEEKLIKHEMLHDLLDKKNLIWSKHHPLFTQCGVL